MLAAQEREGSSRGRSWAENLEERRMRYHGLFGDPRDGTPRVTWPGGGPGQKKRRVGRKPPTRRFGVL